MTTALAPYGAYEVEDEAHQWEVAHEDEDEAEEFFGALASLASRALSNPTLRRVGLGAARAAINAGGRALSDQTGGFSRQAAGYLSGLLPQSEMEAEGEDFVDPFRRVYPNRSLMEHIGHAAAEAEDEDEAEALASSLVPLAARHAPAIHRATPQLTRAVATVARQLHANPSTRPLVRALPSIVNRTAHTVARNAAAGHRITPHNAVRTLAQHTARTLSSPRQLVRDYRRSQRLEQHHHARSSHPGYRPGIGVHPRRTGLPHATGWHPAMQAGRGRHPWWWRQAAAPGGPTHTHAHPHAHTPGAPYGPWRRYAPPPGVRVAPPPPGYPATPLAPAAPAGYQATPMGYPSTPAPGTWNCTCQCG